MYFVLYLYLYLVLCIRISLLRRKNLNFNFMARLRKSLAVRSLAITLGLFAAFPVFASHIATSTSIYDYLVCHDSGNSYHVWGTVTFPGSGYTEYMRRDGTAAVALAGRWDNSTGAYVSSGLGDCANQSMTQLEASGQAFNYGGGSSSSSASATTSTTTVEFSTGAFDTFYLFFGIIVFMFSLQFFVWLMYKQRRV